jgi:hypothetical protein
VASNGFRAEVPADGGIREYTGAVDLGRMTALHSAALDQRPLAGSIGAGFLKNYHLVLDLAAGTMSLGPPREAGAGASRAAAGEILILPLKARGSRILLPLRHSLSDNGKSQAGYMLLSSGTYDSFVSPKATRAAGAPAGNVGALQIGDMKKGPSFDLSRFVAFRPSNAGRFAEFAGETGGSQVMLITGINLLRNFRVEIDRVNKIVAFSQTRTPAYPEGDFAYFEAETSGRAEPMEAFLSQHPDSRLAEEAAQLLIDRRLEEGADNASLIVAARWFRDSVPEKIRGTSSLALMDLFARQRPEQPDLVIAVGELGLGVVRDDADPMILYRIHDAIGRQRLAKGDIKGAWKNFLSAALGMPKDARVNLNLGRTYEALGRVNRARSRYQRASAIVADMRAHNMDALSPEDLAELRSAEARLGDNPGQ